MGLFDEVVAMAAGAAQQPGQHATALSAILDYVNSPQVGGLAGLQVKFQQSGLGNIMSSWIGSGQNLPISADQLQGVLHSGALQQAAQQAGIDPTHLTGMMSTLLPQLVDKLSPHGQLPDASTLQTILKGFAAGKP